MSRRPWKIWPIDPCPGVIQPIVVRQREEQNLKSSLASVAGGPASWSDWKQCLVWIKTSDNAAAAIALIENIQREDLECH